MLKAEHMPANLNMCCWLLCRGPRTSLAAASVGPCHSLLVLKGLPVWLSCGIAFLLSGHQLQRSGQHTPAGNLSVMPVAVQAKVKLFEEGKVQDLTARQPKLDQLQRDLSKSQDATLELTASMTLAQDTLTTSRQQIASLREELANSQSEHRAAQVCFIYATAAHHRLRWPPMRARLIGVQTSFVHL